MKTGQLAGGRTIDLPGERQAKKMSQEEVTRYLVTVDRKLAGALGLNVSTLHVLRGLEVPIDK